MSSVFSVTSASDTSKLDASGHGEIPFTVSNSSGRQLRGRAEVKAPADPAKQSYLKIDGEAERDFPKDGVQQFTVRIQAPPGVQEAKFSFRLDVLSVTNPDEDFTQGPTVSVVVPMLQKERKKFPWWIVAAAAAVLAIIGVGVYLFSGRTTTVVIPDVSSTKSLSLNEAKARLSKLDLKVAPPSLVLGDPKYVDKVIGQEPSPGAEQDSHKPVILKIGGKGVLIPGLGCRDVFAAMHAVDELGLVPQLVPAQPPEGQRTVLSVDGQGTYVKPGDKIALHLGPAPANCMQIVYAQPWQVQMMQQRYQMTRDLAPASKKP